MNIQLQLHEFQEVTTLKKFFDFFKVDLVLDVGANTGQYAQMLRTKVGFKGTIISYEPFSTAFIELKEKTLNDPNWYAFNYALSNVSGTQTLNLVGSSQMNSLLEPTADETKILQSINTKIGEERVEVKLLDQAYEEVRAQFEFSTPFLKLDTQGHDLRILESSSELNNFTGIQTEVSFKSLYEGAPKYNKTIEFLKSVDFELTAIFPNNAGHFPHLLEQDIVAFNPKFFSN